MLLHQIVLLFQVLMRGIHLVVLVPSVRRGETWLSEGQVPIEGISASKILYQVQKELSSSVGVKWGSWDSR